MRGRQVDEHDLLQLGARGDGYVAIKDGVFEDELVVVSANFLIDAESNLRAALNAFTSDQGSKQPMEMPK